jgi:hypothetical protein
LTVEALARDGLRESNPRLGVAASNCLACGCVVCDQRSAALALQTANTTCHPLAFQDADLQRVVNRRCNLEEAGRRAILAIIGLH